MLQTYLLKWPSGVLSVLVAVASWRFFVLGAEMSNPGMFYHALERPIWFYAHIGLAPVALLVMPFQFWTRFRMKHPARHRLLGRIYVISILISGVGGLMMAIGTQAGAFAGFGFGILAVAWLFTTGRAVQLAMQRNIAQHQMWMIRSAALTFAAVTLRIYIPVGQVAGYPFEATYPLIAWACWVPNAMVAEWMIRRRGKPALNAS